MTPAAPWYAGVDVGGTRLKCAVVGTSGEVLARHTEPSAGRAFGDLIDTTTAWIRAQQERMGAGPTGIGVATPGITRLREGPVLLPGRLAGSEGYPLVSRLSTEFGAGAVCLNDGDAAALGEHRFGAARGERRLVVVTLGTGVGGGVLIDGELLGDLETGEGPYLGHIVMDPAGEPCLCGNRGCAETRVSANAVVGRLLAALKRGVPSGLAERFREDPAAIGFEQLTAAARDGDPLAHEVLAGFEEDLVSYLVSLAHLFAPTAIAVGGGVMHASAGFLPRVRAAVRARQFRAPGVPPVRVVRAGSIDFAGARGACVPLMPR
ncbi:MAG TPA: ROK family protein [Pseudolysinimonas sp.]|nr:ROK family protein [Pseudolysinimonas sp.]